MAFLNSPHRKILPLCETWNQLGQRERWAAEALGPLSFPHSLFLFSPLFCSPSYFLSLFCCLAPLRCMRHPLDLPIFAPPVVMRWWRWDSLRGKREERHIWPNFVVIHLAEENYVFGSPWFLYQKGVECCSLLVAFNWPKNVSNFFRNFCEALQIRGSFLVLRNRWPTIVVKGVPVL